MIDTHDLYKRKRKLNLDIWMRTNTSLNRSYYIEKCIGALGCYTPPYLEK
jgi:hypothetical protein